MRPRPRLDVALRVQPLQLQEHLHDPIHLGCLRQSHGPDLAGALLQAPVEVEEGMIGGVEGEVRRGGESGRASTANYEEDHGPEEEPPPLHSP